MTNGNPSFPRREMAVRDSGKLPFWLRLWVGFVLTGLAFCAIVPLGAFLFGDSWFSMSKWTGLRGVVEMGFLIFLCLGVLTMKMLDSYWPFDEG